MIREAHLQDANAVQALLQQLGYSATLLEINNRMQAFANTAHRIFVAERDQQVVGLLSLGLYEQLWTSGPCCRIDTIVVEESYRGKGIGKQLLQRAEHYANENACKIIDLITSDKRKQDGTHAFYSSLGFNDHHHYGFSYFCKEL